MTQAYLNSRFADQGFCDSYTDYRKIHPGSLRLLKRITAHGVLSAATVATAGLSRLTGSTRWRVDLARLFYYRNRVRYDLRLLLHDQWRQFALRDDWISDDPGSAATGDDASSHGGRVLQ
jgi:hypothetical protein